MKGLIAAVLAGAALYAYYTAPDMRDVLDCLQVGFSADHCESWANGAGK